jgi:uncharacterized membrane protein YcaP (DUF421 family)
VLAGVLLAVTLMVMNHVLHRFVFRHSQIESLVEGSPQVLIHNGRISPAVAASANLTDEDIRAELRKAGVADPPPCAGRSSRRMVTSASFHIMTLSAKVKPA